MEKSIQEKLARIMQIQQEIHDLDAELCRLLGEKPEEAEAGTPKVRRSRRSAALETRPAVLDSIRELFAQPGRRATRNAIFSHCRGLRIRTSRHQVSAVVRRLISRGTLEECGMTDDGMLLQKSLD